MGYMTADSFGDYNKMTSETVYYIAPMPGDYEIGVASYLWEGDTLPVSFQLKAIQGATEYVIDGSFDSYENEGRQYTFTYVESNARSAAVGGGFTMPSTQHGKWGKLHSDDGEWYQKALNMKQENKRLHDASTSKRPLAHQA